MGDDELELGGLGDDGGVSSHCSQHLLDPEARVLLVGDRGDDHVTSEPERSGTLAGNEGGGEPGLHVVRAPPVQPVAVNTWFVRRLPCPATLTVSVCAAEHERPPAAAASSADDDAGPTQRRLQHVDLETRGQGPVAQEAADRDLAGAAGNERRVDRVDRHELRGEPNDLALHAERSCAGDRREASDEAVSHPCGSDAR